MEYKKRFNKYKTRITITTPKFSRAACDLRNKERVKERTYEVLDKEEIYEKIKNSEPIDLKDKYVEGFSLEEYRRKNCLMKSAKVAIKDFNAEGAFFDGSFSFLNSVFKGNSSFKYAIFAGDVSLKQGQDFIENIIILGYRKEYNKNKTEVTIAASEKSRGVWDSKEKRFLEEKTFKVIKTEKVYEWLDNKESINLKDKYVEKFSLEEYRKKRQLKESIEVTLKDFNAEGAFFEGETDFSHAVFEGNVYIKIPIYERNENGHLEESYKKDRKGNASFVGSTFRKGKISFEFASFKKGNVYFSLATFEEGNISFSDIFIGKGNVFFDSASFEKGDVSLRHANFREGDLSFKNAFFKEVNNVNFNNLSVKGSWDISHCFGIKTIDFSSSSINGTVNLTWTDINQMRLVNTRLTGKIFISSRELHLGTRKDAINNQRGKHEIKRNQFWLLKENFRSLGQSNDEDKAYVQFMKHSIRSELSEPGLLLDSFDHFLVWGGSHLPRIVEVVFFPIIILLIFGALIIKTLAFAFKWLIYEQIGLYGTSPARIALSMFVIVAGFSWLYSQLPSPPNSTSIPWFHSVITFLTIGYGDKYIPMDSFRGQLLSGIEGFLGLFLMSYFTISFARKVLR